MATPKPQTSAAQAAWRRGTQTRRSRMVAGEFAWDGAKKVQTLNGWDWMITPHLKHMECYFDQDEQRVGMNEQTWTTLGFAHGMEEVEVMIENRAVNGMTFLVSDAGPFRRSLVEEAKAAGRDKPEIKDPITQIEQDAQALIVQAAGINGATPFQMEVFTMRYAEMQRKMADLQERMDRVAGTVQLAGLAVAEAV